MQTLSGATAAFDRRIELLRYTQDLVWTFRENSSTWWHLPTTEDSLAFLVTETGNVIRAHLRLNPQYAKRPEVDPLTEWATVVFMALTVLGGRDFNPHTVMRSTALAVRYEYLERVGIQPRYMAARDAASALIFYLENNDLWQHYVGNVLDCALMVLGDGVYENVRQRLDAIWAKNQMTRITA